MYDPARNVSQTILPSNRRTTVAYDPMNQIEYQKFLGVTTTQSYSMYSANPPTWWEDLDQNGTKNYELDEKTQWQYSKYLPSNNYTTYAYDREGNCNGVHDSQGHWTTWTYDGNNRVTSILNPFHERTTIAYDALDRRAHVLLGNSVAVSYIFDSAGRETARQFYSPTGAWLAGFTATYDAAVGRKGVRSRLLL